MARVWLQRSLVEQKRIHFEDDDEENESKVDNRLGLGSMVTLFVFAAVVSWEVFHYANAADENWLSEEADDGAGDPTLQQHRSSEGWITYKLLKALAIGGGTVVYTWMLTYMDSQLPGFNPPTPSPRKSRFEPLRWRRVAMSKNLFSLLLTLAATCAMLNGCGTAFLLSLLVGVLLFCIRRMSTKRGTYCEFHLAYVMAVANGVVFFCLSFWG